MELTTPPASDCFSLEKALAMMRFETVKSTSGENGATASPMNAPCQYDQELWAKAISSGPMAVITPEPTTR